MIYFCLYIIGMLACLAAAVALNSKYEWLTKEEFEYDVELSHITMVISALLIWPISLFFGILGFGVWTLFQYCVPDKRTKK